MTYVPILKNKPAEYWAWRHASPDVWAGSRVVFDVFPRHGEDRDLLDFVNGVSPGWPAGSVLTFDTGHLDQTIPIAGTASRAVLWTAHALHSRGLPARPVMRLDDDPAVLAEVAAAAAIHGRGACLRLGSEDADPDADEAAAQTPDLLNATGLSPEMVDLIIDMCAVSSAADVGRARPVASAVVQWAAAQGWRTVTVASGAFPPAISHLPVGAPTPLRRFDADLFDAVAADCPTQALDFGDYGINHPSAPSSAGRAPLPNLRYTSDREWQVYRAQRVLPGNQSFFKICAQVVASVHWPASGAAYSAGDAEISRAAGATGGAGAATQWLQFGASHHMAHIIDRLANLGAP